MTDFEDDSAKPATPLDFLQAVYSNEGLELHVRMKAAIEAAPYVHPKLSATAVMSGDGFSIMLEKAIARSRAPLQIEHQPSGREVPPTAPAGIRGRSGSR